MDLMKEYAPAVAEKSIAQFCPPRCFELAGKTYRFVIDTGEGTGVYTLRFTGSTTLEWACGEDAPKAETYECRKADDFTYLLSYNVGGLTPRQNHTWVIDLENELVTFLRCAMGENPFDAYMIESHFGFGYVEVEGKPHTDLRRHGFTDEVTGTCVRWHYGHGMSTIHVYHSPYWYRIGYPRNADTKEVPDSTKKIRALMKKMPSSDEPASYVRIKEKMYLVSVTEQNLEKLLGAEFGFRSDTLCFLDNWDRLMSVGRAFGTKTLEDGTDRELFIMIGKYGSPEEVDERFFTDPIPYLT